MTIELGTHGTQRMGEHAMHMSKETLVELHDGDCVTVKYGNRSITVNGGLVTHGTGEGLRTQPEMWLVTKDKLVIEFGEGPDDAVIVPDKHEGIISLEVRANVG